jgi:clan AA aspartic protease
MIQGVVNAQLQPTVRLAIHDATGQAHDIEVVVDTGYDGALTLPPARVTALGLGFRDQLQARLADGSTQVLNVHEATVIWDGQSRKIEVDAIDISPLLGAALLQGHELRIKFVVGGAVTIEALP